ncbi:hypothetical protein [Luteimonas vadosa]
MDVHKCWHLLERNGQVLGHFITDLIFINDVPHLVFEWESTDGGNETPAAIAALDPQHLHKFGGAAEYMYEFPVADTRKFN